MRPALLLVAFSGLACATARPVVSEQGRYSRSASAELQGGGRAEVTLEELERSYWTRRGWFEGAGGDPPRHLTDSYWVVTGSRRAPQGDVLNFRWIGSAHPFSYFFVRPGRLVFADGDVFLEYTLVPTFRSGRALPRDRTPFGGDPRLLVRWARYVEARPYRPRGGGIELSRTYKWPDAYVWEEVSGPTFERATRSGAVIDLTYDLGEERDRAGTYDWFARRVAPDDEESRFLHAVKGGDAADAERMLTANPALIRAYDQDGQTPLHLAIEADFRRHLLPLLLRFDPHLNAVNFRGETPLHVAARFSAGPAIRDELIAKGARVLNPGESLARLREQYGLPSSVLSRTRAAEDGWVGDDAYEIKVECSAHAGESCHRARIRDEGLEALVRALGLSGAPDSPIARRLGWILDNLVEDRKTSAPGVPHGPGVETTYFRIYAPNLRGVVAEYRAAAGR